ncbi:MAG: hypothetical protein V3U82_06755 [Robiginitomaculum sp.]
MSRPPKPKAILKAYWRFFYLSLYYPVIIAALIWLTVKRAHWGWGLALIAVALLFDPLWRGLWRRFKRGGR